MAELSFFIGGFLPYITVLVFTAGMAFRIGAWIKTPQPARMTLFPLRSSSTLKEVLTETFLFPSLFRGDKVLWWFSWVFHATLALVFVGHLRVATAALDQMLKQLGMSQSGIDTLSSVSGGAAGAVILATATMLIVRRAVTQRVRDISRFGDYLVLALLIAIISSGNLMRFAGHFDLGQTRAWALSLCSFAPAVPRDPAFLAHALLAQTMFMYIPWSKILHFGGIFFTQAVLRGR